jgi:hypothetical protein
MADEQDSPQATAALAMLEATDPDAACNALLALRWITGEGLDPKGGHRARLDP